MRCHWHMSLLLHRQFPVLHPPPHALFFSRLRITYPTSSGKIGPHDHDTDSYSTSAMYVPFWAVPSFPFAADHGTKNPKMAWVLQSWRADSEAWRNPQHHRAGLAAVSQPYRCKDVHYYHGIQVGTDSTEGRYSPTYLNQQDHSCATQWCNTGGRRNKIGGFQGSD